MKSRLGIYGLFAAMSMMGTGAYNETKEYEPKETEEQKRRRLSKFEIKRNKSNGLNEFFYGENSVWAINQKNADKKAKRKGYI